MATKKSTDTDTKGVEQVLKQMSIHDSKTKIMKDWDDLKERVKSNSKEEVEFFFHVTESRNSRGWSKLEARSETSDIKGVWFCVTLYNGQLPTQSPYGRYRVCIPIRRILAQYDKWSLFVESIHYYPYHTKNRYVRFVLVKDLKEQPDDVQKSCAKLPQVGLTDNPIFGYNPTNETGYCLKNVHPNYPHYWVEVLIVGEVDIDVRDEVKNTERTTATKVDGLLPSSK